MSKEILHTYQLKRGGGGENWVMKLSRMTSSHVSAERRRGTATVLQQHHNNLHCHNITGRWEEEGEGGACVCFWRASSESGECRASTVVGEGVVCPTPRCGGYQSKEMSCASALPGGA